MQPEFVAFLKAQGIDDTYINDPANVNHLKVLKAMWEIRQPVAAAPAPVAPAPVSAGVTAPAGGFDATMNAILEESARVQYIRERTVVACRESLGDNERIKELQRMCEAACADTKTTRNDYDLALLRFSRGNGPIILNGGSSNAPTEEVLEAAVCVAAKLPNVEKHYNERALEAAHKRFRRGIGLTELLQIAAERNNNYRGSPRDIRALCQAAFRPNLSIQADVGPSTIAVPGILSNIANKFLAAGFMFTEQTWRDVSKIRPANDFKTMTTYRLTGANKFQKVAPGGEIQDGTLGQLSYTNQVDTYGIKLGIDRRDIRNDDLNAFTSIGMELGRGAGDALNTVFWTEFLDDSSFFPTNGSNSNYHASATDSALAIAGLDKAESMLRLQTKTDGTPLGARGAIILTPAILYNTGLQLMGSQGLVVGTTPASGPSANVFYGRYRVVSSVFLDAVATIGSTAWYLLCDPNDIAVIETAFLDGVETPTVETNDFDFDRLGMTMRGFMDFGCNKQEYRGGVKQKGAA